METQDNLFKQFIKTQLDITRQYTEQEKADLKAIIETAKTAEDCIKAILLYFVIK